MPNKNSHLDLHIDQLEKRQMLAGNVTVALTGAGDLKMVGDNLDNDVTMGFEGGQMFIVGQGDTTINGKNSETISSAEIRDFKINFRGGDDSLDIGKDGPLLRNAVINMGTGVDSLTANSLNTTGNVSLKLGSGAKGGDSQFLSFSGKASGSGRVIDGDLVISGSDDFDVQLVGDDLGLLIVGGDTKINTGAGVDNVEIVNFATEGDLSLKLGSGDKDGDNQFLSFSGKASGSGRVIGGDLVISGSDDIDVQLVGDDLGLLIVGGDTKINTGTGADNVEVMNFATEGDLSLKLGDGDKDGNGNFLSFHTSAPDSGQVVGGDLTVTSGSGADVVNISAGDVQLGVVPFFGDAKFSLGGGSDNVELYNFTTDGDLSLKLGSGEKGGESLQSVEVFGPATFIGGELDVAGGGQSEHVYVDGGSLNDVSINLKGGEDSVTIVDLGSEASDFKAIGGSGFDEIFLPASFDVSTISGFESVVNGIGPVV